MFEADEEITEIDDTEIKVLPELERGNDTEITDVLALINFDANFQTYELVDIDDDDAEVSESDFELDNDDHQILVTAQDGDATEYYTITVLDKLDDTSIVEEEDQEVFTVNGDGVEVVYGTTVEELLAAIDEEELFQAVTVHFNNLDLKETGEVRDFNVLRVEAQDGTVKLYTLFVADEVVEDSDDVSVSTDVDLIAEVDGLNITVEKFIADDDEEDGYRRTLWSDLIEALEEDDEDRSYEVVTSSGSEKVKGYLFDYDLLVVTAEDGEETETYTIHLYDNEYDLED